jgi:biotin synthase-like enzyme
MPTVETLEKFARVLEDPMDDHFYATAIAGVIYLNCSENCSFCQYSDPTDAN